MTHRFHRTGITLAITLALALAVPVALAQTPPAAQPQPPAPARQDQAQGATGAQAGTGPAPSQAELKHFALAAVAVQGIRKSMQPKLAAAQTADARTQIKASAEKQMEAVVRSNDLTLHRYVQIADAVQTNSKLRTEVEKLMPPAPAPAASKS